MRAKEGTNRATLLNVGTRCQPDPPCTSLTGNWKEQIALYLVVTEQRSTQSNVITEYEQVCGVCLKYQTCKG